MGLSVSIHIHFPPTWLFHGISIKLGAHRPRMWGSWKHTPTFSHLSSGMYGSTSDSVCVSKCVWVCVCVCTVYCMFINDIWNWSVCGWVCERLQREMYILASSWCVLLIYSWYLFVSTLVCVFVCKLCALVPFLLLSAAVSDYICVSAKKPNNNKNKTEKNKSKMLHSLAPCQPVSQAGQADWWLS